MCYYLNRLFYEFFAVYHAYYRYESQAYGGVLTVYMQHLGTGRNESRRNIFKLCTNFQMKSLPNDVNIY